MKRDLVRTSAYVRAARRHIKKNARLASDVEATLQKLSEDAFDSRLKTHKLKGALDGVWACTVGPDLRILFQFSQDGNQESIELLSIGTHDEVY